VRQAHKLVVPFYVNRTSDTHQFNFKFKFIYQ